MTMKEGLHQRTDPQRLLVLLGVAVLYFLSARLSLLVVMESTHASPLWLPSGVGLAAVLLMGYRIWPGLLVGALAANFLEYHQAGAATLLVNFLATIFTSAGNTLEAVAGLFLIRSFTGSQDPFRRIRHTALFAGATLLMCLVSAIIGPVTLCLTGIAPWARCLETGLFWWIGDVVGILILTPFLLSWFRKGHTDWAGRKYGEALLLSLLFLATVICLCSEWPSRESVRSLLYMVIPFLLWAAIRFNLRAASLAMVALSCIALFCTYNGQGPFVRDTVKEAMIHLQVFMGVVSITVTGLAVSVLERKNIEKSMHESEKRYRSIVEDSPGMLCSYLPDGVITYVNERYCRYFGKSREELVGSRFLSLIPEVDREAVMNTLLSISVDDSIKTHEHPVISGQGDICWHRWTNRGLFDVTGRIAGFQAFGEDVTDQKRAEEALTQARSLLQAAIECMPAGVIIADAPDVNIRMANSAALGIRGESIDPLTHIPVELHPRAWQVFHPDGTPYDPEDLPLSRAVLKGETVLGEEVIIRNTGREDRWVLANAAPVRNAEGEITAGIVVFPDITERKEAEEELRGGRERLHLAVETMPVMIDAFDGEGNIIVWNHECERVTGYTAEEMVGNQGAFELLYPEEAYRQQVLESIRNRSGDFRDLEFTLIRKDGEKRTISWANLSEAHPIPGWDSWAVGIDVTQRKRAEKEQLALERQVQHAQKIESLGVLAGGIAHDFNNILMAILGNADLALQSLTPHAPARESIQDIETAARRAAVLARQMLAYSGKGRFVNQPVDLNEFLKEITPLLEVSISKKASLDLHFGENLPPFDGDASQIRQVILNLVINGAEAMVDGGETEATGHGSGTIRVTTGALTCDRAFLDSGDMAFSTSKALPLEEGGYVYLEVSDTGCGMDRRTLEKIFEPFFTTKFTGRGLGMAAVSGIVRGHKGFIRIQSEPDRGTEVKVFFPESRSRDGDGKSVEEAREEDAWKGTGTILVVDDEEAVLNMTRRMLEQRGFKVLMAADGRKGIELFRNHGSEIACVLMDLTMPHMDGDEAFREMRRIRKEVPVILSSGFSEDDLTQRFNGQGLAGFIQKPYNIEDLMDKLKTLTPPNK